MIQFRIVTHSGVPPYLQLVQQVRQAVHAGMLREGDRLPTIKDALQMVTVNPNTIAKAYRELESLGIVKGRPGIGTFVVGVSKGPAPAIQRKLTRQLADWVRHARAAGLDDQAIADLFDYIIRRGGNDETN